MNGFLSSADLKSLAKGQLLGKYKTVVGAYAIHMACILFATFCAYLLVDTSSLIGTLIYYAVTLLISLLGGLFLYGEAYIYLKIACSQKVSVGDLFYGFWTAPDKIIKVQLAFAIVSLVCGLPNLLAVPMAQDPANPYLMLLFVILMIFTTVFNVIFSLTFSQCYYLMLDFPRYSPREVFEQSYRITKGNRGRLFYIELSFVPLIILGICSCCITFLWVLPYFHATRANFYLDLVRKQKRG